jgi:hypothetical protein
MSRAIIYLMSPRMHLYRLSRLPIVNANFRLTGSLRWNSEASSADEAFRRKRPRD